MFWNVDVGSINNESINNEALKNGSLFAGDFVKSVWGKVNCQTPFLMTQKYEKRGDFSARNIA